MSKILRDWRAALTAIGLSVLLGSCSLFGGGADNPMDSLRDAIRDTVADVERADSMIESVDEMEAIMVEGARQLADAVRQQRQLFADYDSTPQDFERLAEQWAPSRDGMQDSLVSLHQQFKAKATPDEWQSLSPAERSAVTSRAQMLTREVLSQR